MSNKCPICGKTTQVIDTDRTIKGTRRRRKCAAGHRHSTLEVHADDLKHLRMLAEEEEVQAIVRSIVQINSITEHILKGLGEKK